MISPLPSSSATALLEDLVRINSANPATYPGGPGEGDIVAYCHDFLARRGLACHVVDGEVPEAPAGAIRTNGTSRPTGPIGTTGPARPARPSLLASLDRPRARGGRSLLLVGHLDTHGWHETCRRDGDRLHGPGAYDMKAGVAAILRAMVELSRRGSWTGSISAVLVADEEHRGVGMRQVAPRLDADGAIVAEGSGLQLGLGHDGRVLVAVYCATPAERAALLVDLAMALRHEPGRLGRGLQVRDPGSTPAVRSNLVLCRPLTSNEDAATVVANLTAVLARCTSTPPRFEVRPAFSMIPNADRLGTGQPAFGRITSTPPAESQLVGSLSSALSDHGRGVSSTRLTGWTEAALLAERGIPTVVFGPGGGGAHTEHEWVSVADTEAAAAILISAALSYLGEAA